MASSSSTLRQRTEAAYSNKVYICKCGAYDVKNERPAERLYRRIGRSRTVARPMFERLRDMWLCDTCLMQHGFDLHNEIREFSLQCDLEPSNDSIARFAWLFCCWALANDEGPRDRDEEWYNAEYLANAYMKLVKFYSESVLAVTVESRLYPFERDRIEAFLSRFGLRYSV